MRAFKVIVIALLLLGPMSFDAQAQMATQDEALTVANSWIARVIGQEGKWGDSDQAQVLQIEPFTRDGRVLGYFCRVEPAGFIAVSLYRELAPIKAYSAESNLDPDADGGMTDLLKTKMAAILDALQPAGGSVRAASVPSLEVDYRPAWDTLLGVSNGADSLGIASNYQNGQSPLVTSRWHQLPPYNNLCPSMGCSWPAQGYQNQRAPAGCGALAIAQIMRYWAWPPEGMGRDDANNVDFGDAYDWTNMLDAYYWSNSQSAFTDGSGTPCASGPIAAVAELCYEVGRALSSTYECAGTTSSFPYYQGLALTSRFHYHNKMFFAERSKNTALQWFNGVKADLAENRLVSYYIPNHFVVVDGWAEDAIGKRYHVNYGWADENTTAWYNLDELPGGNLDEEAMLMNIRPAVALLSVLTSNQVYGREAFNYRYFDQDATGQNVTFAAGQKLQFLPKVSVNCTGGSIRFQAAAGSDTELFSIKGTDQGKIRILGNSALVLNAGGGIRFHGTR